MWGIKDTGVTKTIGLALLIIIVIAVILSKNNNTVMRYMVGREVELKTAHFHQIETDNFNIRYTLMDKDDMGTVAKAAEYAYATVTDFFDFELSRKTMVVVYPDTASLAHSFGWDKSQKAEGVYWASSIRIISPQLWQEEANTVKAGPLVHEFAHLMVDEQTRGNYNRWWTEGIAQYVEKKITGFQFQEPFTSDEDIKLFTLTDLNKNFDREEGMIAYWQSLKIIEYIVDFYGEESLFIIMDNLGQGDNIKKAIAKALQVNYMDWEQTMYQALQKN